MTYASIFKKSFLEGWASTDIGTAAIVTTMIITAVIAAYIFVVYRVVTKKTFYSKSFAVSLASVALTTAAIIITIQSSIVVSLGMVGALSIVRFRTAIKDPMDLAFLFWAISTGIICGAGLSEFALVLAVANTLIILLLQKTPIAKAPMILVVNAESNAVEPQIMAAVEKYAKHSAVKARNMTSTTLDMTVELRVENEKGGQLLAELVAIPGVAAANLMAHDGEVAF